MNIALVDVDGHSGFPNLALMRLSAWHKAQGDSVEWWNGFTHYDRVYLSKVFTFTPDFDTVIDADEIITGGTGYKDYTNLPPEVGATPPAKWCEKHGKTLDEVEQAAWDVGVAIQDGRMFHGPCHLRINLALPLSRVKEAFGRLDQYVFNP